MSDKKSSGTVLIVDDNTPAAEMLCQIFKMRGYTAIHIDNGEEAIEVTQNILPDIILLDVMMPVMNGYEVMQTLKASKSTADIPIIFVTARDDAADIEEGLGLGADDYVPKPVKPREILARVRTKLEARQLQQNLTKRTTELEALLRFSQELNNQQDVDSLLNIILYLVLDLIPSSMAVIYHMDENRGVKDYREQRSSGKNQDDVDVEILFNELLAHDCMLVWENNKIKGSNFEHGISICLDYGEQLHGILVILSDKPYNKHESRLFETLARQTTLALRNAEIYGHLEDMVEKRTNELRSAEQLLVRSEKLASVGRLAAGIAHEINNPLMPIRMNLEMMQEDIQENVPITERDIKETLNSVNRISRIVERLQEFTRGRGEDSLEMLPLNVSDIIESVLRLSSTFIRHGGIEITTKLDENTKIYGNPDQLEQVFLNIILNAQAAMENGGELKIEMNTTSQTTIISISDTGSGIEPDMIEKIFEPFISSKEKGSGLGLFISHNIIHNHSGQIEVVSEVGKGTTFIITLPIVVDEPI